MNRNFIFASLIVAIGLNIAIIGCHRKDGSTQDDGSSNAVADTLPVAADTLKNPYENSIVEVKTYPNKSPLTGYGYDLFVDGVLKVHQPHIPAIPGTRGFSSEAYAKQAGELVAFKVKNNIMPPSVTPEELDSLGVLK